MKNQDILINNISKSNLSKKDKRTIINKIKGSIIESNLSINNKKTLVNKLKGDSPDLNEFLIAFFKIVKIGGPLLSLFHIDPHDWFN